jgi:cell pole-organizing protein PopZ
MEEILASIRRIIADDDSAKPAAAQPAVESPPPRPAAPPPRQVVPPQPAALAPAAVLDQEQIDTMLAGLDAQQAAAEPTGDDVLDLTEQMEAPPAGEVPSFQTIDGQSDVFFADAPAEPPLRPTEMPRAVEEPEMAEEPRLAEMPQPQYPPQPSPSEPRPLMSSNTSAAVDSAFSALAQTVLVQNARTLEDLVREMLRPMLKSWLDDNLPGMVERIVRSEIERVSRGR